jgi:uncharacterized membrane protein YbhN (UPF0104 family)
MRDFAGRRILWIVAALLMAALIYWGRKDLHLVLTLDLRWVGVCFAGTLGVALCAALKWRISLNAIGEKRAAHFGSLLHYFMIGRAIGLVLPMDVSDLGVRTMSLKYDHSVSVGRASYSVFLDRTFDVMVAGIFLVPSVLFIAGTLPARACMILYALTYAAGFLSLVLFGRQSMRMLQGLFRFLFRLVCRIPWVGKRAGDGTDIDLLDSSEVAPIAPNLFLVSGLKFLFISLRYYAIAAALGIALGSDEIMAFVPSAQYAALLALTPGGLGIADWSWSGLLYKIGVGKEHLVPYLISLRLVITLSVVALALISRLAYRKPQPKEK